MLSGNFRIYDTSSWNTVYKCIHGGESDGTAGWDTDRYLGIIITDRSSQDRAGETLVGREECGLRDEIRFEAILALGRENRVAKTISCFSFDSEGYRAKVRMLFYSRLVCFSFSLSFSRGIY